MFKKVIALFLAASMTVACLAACGETADPTKGSEKETESAKPTEGEDGEDATEGASGEVTNVVVYRTLYNRNAVDSDAVKNVENKINEYLASKGATCSVTIKEVHNSEYSDKANLALANGEMNILWTAHWWGTIGTNDIWRQNGAADITELVQGTPLWGSMPEGIWEAAKYAGRIYFIPVYKEAYEGYDIKTTKALADEFGWNFDDVLAKDNIYDRLVALEPYLQDCVDKGLKYPWATSQFFYRWYLDYFDIFNSDSLIGVDRATNEIVTPIKTDLYAEYCKLQGEWYKKGFISEDVFSNSVPSGMNLTQDWGFQFWTCVPGGELANSESRDQQAEVIVEGFTNKYIRKTTGSCFTITASSSEAEVKAAIEFLGYLYTDEYVATLYTYGIEGVDYDLDANGRVVLNTDALYSHSPWESAPFTVLPLLDSEPEDKIQDYLDKNNAAAVSCAAGFQMDLSDPELNAIYVACSALNEEYGKLLELGYWSGDEVDAKIAEYITALEAAGYNTFFDAIYQQYEDWKASK